MKFYIIYSLNNIKKNINEYFIDVILFLLINLI